jgi:hypothetical protein
MRDLLTEEQVKFLKLTNKTLKDKKIADRIKAVLILHYGFTTFDVVSPTIKSPKLFFLIK